MISLLRTSRFRLIASVWGASLLFLLFQGGKLAFMLFAGFTAIVAYLFLVSRSGIGATQITRRIPEITNERVSAGTELSIHLDFYIPGFMPIPYVLVTEKLQRLNGKEMTFETSFVPDWRRRGDVTIKTPPLSRGRYSFTTVSCAVEDIFGFYQYQEQFHVPFSFTVYPQKVTIRDWREFNLMYRGRHLHSINSEASRETTQFNGIREYIHGDPMSRIHWNASARTGTWKSKEYEKETLPRMMIVLDCESEYANSAHFETAVSTATSLLDFGFNQDLPVGLMTNEEEPFFAEPQRAGHHYEKILNRLIDVEDNGTLTLAQSVQARQADLDKRLFLVFITSRIDQSFHQLLRWIRLRGIQSSIIQITERPKPGVLPWQKDIFAAGIPSYRIGRLSELPAALGGSKG